MLPWVKKDMKNGFKILINDYGGRGNEAEEVEC